MNRLCGILLPVFLAFAVPLAAAEPARWTLELELRGERVQGAPLRWDNSQVDLLGRDGRLWTFAPKDAAAVRKVSTSFRGYSSSEVRDQLSRELGSRLTVTGVGHYLVAHPPGPRQQWAKRFEDLYRSFMHYFTARGFDLDEPEFPLVAIVYPTQQEFMRAAREEGVAVDPGVLGFYTQASNRLLMFDSTSGNSGEDWSENAATIIHEATHQTAFNTGVHRRFAPAPRWLVEGLAVMFEAPGVWNSGVHRHRQDRVNALQLAAFRHYQSAGRRAGMVAEMIAGDRVFRTTRGAAYAEAWALSFYLSETQPREYGKYLSRVASRPPFEPYSGADRTADFTKVFGSDLRMLEARYLRFMDELK